MPLVSSQGVSFGGGNARKVTIKKSRPKPGDNKLDASTLAIPHGGDRVYEDGLVDNGPNGGNGITITAAVEFMGSPAASGSTATWNGTSLKCIDSETTNDAGALVQGVANYTSDYSN